MASTRFLQTNLNHCARAQDLLLQSLVQWSINIAVVAEPYHVPPRAEWAADLDGLVAITCCPAAGTPALENVVRMRGCVAARIGNAVVVGVYFSPNRALADFEGFLVDLGTVVARSHPLPVAVLGDFNAKSTAWGSPATSARGRILEEWAVSAGLLILNRGNVNTCVRMRGGSIVDLSFASPALARRVQGWRVMAEVETLSDHRYIRFDVSTQTSSALARTAPNGNRPRWAISRFDREALLEASIVRAWASVPDRPVDIEMEAEWFRRTGSQLCDAAMPRVRAVPAKRQVYWWSRDIGRLHANCSAARRQYTRYRRRRRRNQYNASREAELYEGYRAAKKALQSAIAQAKLAAWDELLGTLDRDPWGRPYLLVRGKLRQSAPPLSQSLQPELLEEVVGALFPETAGFSPPLMAPPVPDVDENDDVPEVTREELRAAVKRLQAKNTAPGPDGIPGRVWVLALRALGPRFRGLLSACLERGQFPERWKTGTLVLLRKEGRPADSPSAYRPIVLLDEVGKLFERIIADRLVHHLKEVGPDLADNQFGFRQRRSTIDAILCVRRQTEETVTRGGVVLAVSLDIANAFNTLPWSCISAALGYHRVPPYLRRIIGAYLSTRAVEYPGQRGQGRREMSCGVPQGSVLGPLLWNIGYDWVLRGALPDGVSVVCYADDTLVLARGDSHRQAQMRSTAGVAQVVSRIRRLGLEVALNKSEALCFHGPRNRPPPGTQIMVGGVSIGVSGTMRYLGLTLDGRWAFGDHFRRLAPKLMGSAAALARLLPNLGGPNASIRRLYCGIVRSMAMYGAPVWGANLTARNVAMLRPPQRAMAVRIIRGYRTISFEAASLLAGSMPWDLEARALASLYRWREEALERGLRPAPCEVEAQRAVIREVLVAEWRARLEQPSAGHATIVAVRPVFNEWLERRHGALTFRLTQVLTGHGCFGRYLCRIGREVTSECHHCEDRCEDTALHTLFECPSWDSQRRDLVAAVGAVSLSLPDVISSMIRSESAWAAVASFCEEVMAAKEEAERERERSVSSRSGRARGFGRRRRRALADLRPP